MNALLNRRRLLMARITSKDAPSSEWVRLNHFELDPSLTSLTIVTGCTAVPSGTSLNIAGEPCVANLVGGNVIYTSATNGVILNANISNLHRGAQSLTHTDILNASLADWNEVEIGANAFEDCHALTGSPMVGPRLSNMFSMYNGCWALTGTAEVPETVIDATRTYNACGNLSTLRVTLNANESYTKYYRSTFYNCNNATAAYFNGNSLQNNYDMDGIFEACRRIKNVQQNFVFNCKNYQNSFCNCTNLTVAPSFNNQQRPNCASMFENATNLSIDISRYVTNIANAYFMFYNTKVYLAGYDLDLDNCWCAYSTFRKCRNIVGSDGPQNFCITLNEGIDARWLFEGIPNLMGPDVSSTASTNIRYIDIYFIGSSSYTPTLNYMFNGCFFGGRKMEMYVYDSTLSNAKVGNMFESKQTNRRWNIHTQGGGFYKALYQQAPGLAFSTSTSYSWTSTTNYCYNQKLNVYVYKNLR